MAVDGVGSLGQYNQDVCDVGVVSEGRVVPYAGVERDEGSLWDAEDFDPIERDFSYGGSGADVYKGIGVEGQDSFAGAVVELGDVDDWRSLADAAGGE